MSNVRLICSGLGFKYYLTVNPQKVRERPRDRLETARDSVPSNSIGFLPMWSDMRLQNMTVARAANWRMTPWNEKKKGQSITFSNCKVAGQVTDHQPGVISDFLCISYHGSKQLINMRIPWVKSIVIGFKYVTITSFKKGKRTKTEAASQNRRRRRIAIWESGRGVYFLSELLALVVGEPDSILDGWGNGSDCSS